MITSRFVKAGGHKYGAVANGKIIETANGEIILNSALILTQREFKMI